MDSLPSKLKSSNNINTFKHKIKEIFSEEYKKRKMTYMSFTKDRFLEFLLFCRQKPFVRSHFFSYTSGGTIMETRLHRPF